MVVFDVFEDSKAILIVQYRNHVSILGVYDLITIELFIRLAISFIKQISL